MGACLFMLTTEPAHKDKTMPEMFRSSTDNRIARDSTAVAAAAESHLSDSPQTDEFVLGYRDCASESIRYLESATLIASDTGGAETGARRLVDELQVHLIEHEAETMQRRRRHPSNNDNELGRSTASLRYVEHRQSLQQRPSRRRWRRCVGLTPVSMHSRRLNSYPRALRYTEEIQSVHYRSKYDSWNASETVNTSEDSSCNRSLTADMSGVLVDDDTATAAAGSEFCQENMDEVRLCATHLSNLAERDVRVGRLLTELFQLMDSDDD